MLASQANQPENWDLGKENNSMQRLQISKERWLNRPSNNLQLFKNPPLVTFHRSPPPNYLLHSLKLSLLPSISKKSRSSKVSLRRRWAGSGGRGGRGSVGVAQTIWVMARIVEVLGLPPRTESRLPGTSKHRISRLLVQKYWSTLAVLARLTPSPRTLTHTP